jgi:hypothetical protein
MKEIIPEYSYQPELVQVPNEAAESVLAPMMDISRAFAAGAGQD